MTRIKRLYSMGEEMLSVAQRPCVVKKVKLAFASAINKLDSDIVANSEQLGNLEVKVAKGDVESIREMVKIRIKIDEQKLERATLEGIRADLWSKDDGKTATPKESDGDDQDDDETDE